MRIQGDRQRIAAAFMMGLVVWCLAAVVVAQELRYQGKPGQQFAYDIQVTVEAGQSTINYQGVARYTVDATNDQQFRVTYRGGLNESRKTKQPAGGRPFGPPGFGGPRGFGGFPGFPDPFSRPAFAGKTQTTNRITLTPLGAVLAMEGDSQLPYLLGNVALMPFEKLPEGDQKEWTVDSGIAITEKNENQRRPFGPLGPFANNDPQSVQAGRETTRYSIESRDAKQVVVKKSYQLSTPKTGDQPAFDLTGSGHWTFDPAQSLPLSLDFSQKLVVHSDNTDVTIPITIKYRLLTAEDIARLDAEAKQRLEEHQKAVAEAQRQRETPLTPEEKSNALAGLTSGDPLKVLEALKQLRGKTPKEPDPEVVAAIQVLLGDRNKKIQADAQETLVNWSPTFKTKIELNKAYAGHMPVKSTDRAVTDANALYIGQLVQVHLNRAFWYPAEILDFLKDGRVMVRTRGLGAREQTVARGDIQLAPDEVDQPEQPAGEKLAGEKPAEGRPANGKSGPRTWTNHTGEHKTEATYVGFADGKVRLRRADGKEVSVPLELLSKEDQQYVQELKKTAPKVENPFQ